MSKFKKRSKPEKTGECLEDYDDVIRLGVARQSDENDISAKQFEFSSEERNQEWKRISVWETSLTTPAQAVQFVINPERKLIMILNTGEIRGICDETNQQLDVKWDRLPDCLNDNNQKIADYKEGCEGHCAIDGWATGKKLRKRQRFMLAQLALRSQWYFI